MVSNEDILMQFTAQDDVSSVVAAMESSVTSSLDAITSAMDNLDNGLSNLAATSEIVSSAFDGISISFETATDSADNFQTSISNIDSSNVENLSSDFSGLSDVINDAEGDVENLANSITSLDGTSINVDINGGAGIEEINADDLGGNVSQDTSALRTSMYDDIVGASNAIASVGNQAVESASAAEQGWLKLGNAINNTGGNWTVQENNIRSWVKTYSESMGRGIADTRSAMTTFLNMGMSLEQTQDTMKAVSNYAAQFGISQTEASKMIQMSFMGAGRSIKKLGLDIKDFKDSAGNVDKEKLLAAIMDKTSGAADKYANTYEARVQRMNNAINSLKTDFGKEIINTIEPLMPVVQQLVSAFIGLPQPVKSAVLAFGGLAGGAAIIAGPLIKMRAYLRMGGELKSLKTGIDGLKVGFQGFSNGGIRQAIDALKKWNEARKAGQQVNAATKAGDATNALSKETKQVLNNTNKIGSMSGEASSASAGMKATSVSLKGIGQGAMSMLAPLLEIAIVVAVIIPVITALSAEALIFLKGLQLLIDALDFDKIDLTATIAAMKQIGQALIEMGVAMAAMTFTNVMTSLAVLTSGLTGLVNPVQVAGKLLVEVANELQQFKAVKIDESVTSKLKQLSTTLGAVSSAMGSLTNVVLSMAMGNVATLGGLLGNVTTAMQTARREITMAADEIAKIKNLPDIDQTAVDKLTKISESIESVSKAMDGLRSIRDNYNWDSFMQGLFGGVDIQSALDSVKQDIINAGNSLQQYTGLPDIPEDVGNRLKKIADALKSAGESMEVLRSVRDNYNWDSFMQGLFGGVDIPTALNNSRSILMRAGTSLQSMQSLPDIPDGIYTKVQRIGTSTKNVGDTLRLMSQVNFPDIVSMALLPAKIIAAKTLLESTSKELASLTSVQTIPDGIYTKVQRVGTSARNVGIAVQGINTIPNVSPETAQKIRLAVSAVRTTAGELNKLQGLNAGGGIEQILASVRAAINQLRGTLNSMGGGFRSAGVNIGSSLKGGIRAGLAGLPSVVVSNVSSGMNAGVGIAASGGTRIGNAGKTSFQSSFKISQVAADELNYASQALQNGSGAFYQTVREIAQQAVQEAKNAAGQNSPGHIARMWGMEMDYSSMMLRQRGAGLIRSVKDITNGAVNAVNPDLSNQLAFNSPELTASQLSTIRGMSQGTTYKNNPNMTIINTGDFNLDARNLTTTESRQIVINALEGLSAIDSVITK